MLLTAIATIAIGAVAVAIYVWREQLGLSGLGLAALRTVALGALVFLLVNPSRFVEANAGPPAVLLDASLSMGAAGGAWARALDTARALAGSRGSILRFGLNVEPFDTAPPAAGASRVAQALTAADATQRPVVLVTDGELEDWEMLPPPARAGIGVVLVPRDTAADAALLDVSLPARARADDSLPVTVTIGTWGPLASRAAQLEVTVNGRRLAGASVDLPPPPGTVRRTVTAPPGLLREGEHVVTIRLRTPGDREPRTDVRQRVVRIAGRPDVVLVADPADWEGRFLARTAQEVSRASFRAYARVGPERWIDMTTQRETSPAAVAAARRAAEVVIARGAAPVAPPGVATWWWPSASDSPAAQQGEWYLSDAPAPSPLAAQLAGVAWGEFAPLTALLPAPRDGDWWVGLVAQRARRGPEHAVLVGRVAGGGPALVMLGQGAWRWALRGGREHDAYRALVAAGLDWLLEAGRAARADRLIVPTSVTRGTPVPLKWTGARAPDSLAVEFRSDGSTLTRVVRFDADGLALVSLDPGAYRWEAAGAAGTGVVVVESYSDEFRPRAVVVKSGAGEARGARIALPARTHWWLFAMIIAALVGEWAWRQRSGLP